MEFFSFIEKLGFKDEKNTEVTANLTEIENETEIKKILKKLASVPHFAVSANYEEKSVKEIIVSEKDNIYVLKNQNLNDSLEKILKIPQKKVIYNFKNLMKKNFEIGISPNKNIFDIMLAAYLLSPSDKDYSVKRIAEKYNISLLNSNISGNKAKLEEAFLLN